MELRDALNQVAEIRQRMAEAELFRGYRAAPALGSGLGRKPPSVGVSTALSSCSLNSLSCGCGSRNDGWKRPAHPVY